MARTNDHTIHVGDIELFAQTYGNQDDAPVLLIAGMSASMLWWPAEICEAIAGAGFFVVRYDQRDTGLSTSFPRGRPGYSTDDLTTDVVALCDSLGIHSAHVVGHSLGSLVATILALDYSDRVRSVTLMSATTGDSDLPPGTSQSPELPSDLESFPAIIDYLIEDTRACDGLSPRFDDDRIRRFVTNDVYRTIDIGATISNPFVMEFTNARSGDLGDISIPTLVVHGERDSLFPLAHGEAVARAIPGADFTIVPGAGHTLLTADPDDVARPLITHFLAAEKQ